MASLAYSQSTLFFTISYFVITILLGLLWYSIWRRAQRDDAWHGKLAHPSFWKWILWEHDGLVVYINWLVVLIFLFNVFRLVITLIYGLKGE